MSYLLDKKLKQKKIFTVLFVVIAFAVLFYFRSGIFHGLSYTANKASRPFIVLGHNIGERLGSMGAYFSSKKNLASENEMLKTKLEENNASMSNYSSILADNASLREILGRKDSNTPMILAAILERPNQSPYDTLLIDAGSNEGVRTGDTVFAVGDVPLGRVATVFPDTSKVILFSTSGEKTQAIVTSAQFPNGSASVGNVSMEAVGRGGGNFEIILPRDFTPQKGDRVVLPGVVPHVLGIVTTVISDPRDSFIKALLVSPVNVQELKFLEVETQK